MINNYNELEQHVLNNYPNEICGLIIDNKFVPVQNTHPEPDNNFRIDPTEYLRYKLSSNIQYIIHSHCYKLDNNEKRLHHDFRIPSMSDMIGISTSDEPWLIVSTNGEDVSQPLEINIHNPPELLQRPYLPNVFDCYTLYRDYLKINFNITTKVWPRPLDWKSWNMDVFNNFVDEHIEINNKDAQKGDLILMKYGSKTINHCGVAISNSQFYHQNATRLSCQESLNKYQKFIVKVVRHKELVK